MRRPLSDLMILAAAFMPTSETVVYRKKQPRPCLNCDQMHKHNNAYCSAKCCTEHRESNHGKT